MSLGTLTIAKGTFNRHLTARNHRRASRRKAMLLGLNLTAMVDMFSLLVIFLLQSFSTSPELLVVARGVELPSASTGREIKDAPLLSLSAEGVFLDQKLIGTAEALLRDPTPLMDKLAKLRDLWVRSHPDQAFPGEINFQAHRELPSTVVSQFMAMLPSQNFSSIQLAVVSGRAGASK